MSFTRIWAVFMRYFYVSIKLDYLTDLLYWPTIDILLWGLTSFWLQKQDQSVPNIALVILTGLVFWQIIWRGNYEITVNLLQEFWNRNLVNLFATPLKISEWMSAVMLLGLAKIAISMSFGAFLVYLLYALNVFTIGWAFLPFCFSLALSGWFMGFLSASAIVYWGQRVQTLAWTTAYVFSPFSAVFYPVSALPNWAQQIAYLLPTTYIFEGMRKVLYEGVFSWNYFLTSIGLNILYLFLTATLFKTMFEKSRVKGLSRLE